MTEQSEYHEQLKKLRASILYTIDAVPKSKIHSDGTYLRDVFDSIGLLIDGVR